MHPLLLIEFILGIILIFLGNKYKTKLQRFLYIMGWFLISNSIVAVLFQITANSFKR